MNYLKYLIEFEIIKPKKYPEEDAVGEEIAKKYDVKYSGLVLSLKPTPYTNLLISFTS